MSRHTIEIDREWIGQEDDDEDDPGNWKIISIPAIYEVCPTCNGEGRHVNPSIDGRGLTREDFDELGPDFMESYFRGDYDIACQECKGLRVILVPDRENADPELLAQYDKDQEELAASYAEQRAEMIAEYGPEYSW